MANMILVYKVMPQSGEQDYSLLEEKVKSTVENYSESSQVVNIDSQSMGFGLQAARVELKIDEEEGSEGLEQSLREQEEVGDVSVEMMDREG